MLRNFRVYLYGAVLLVLTLLAKDAFAAKAAAASVKTMSLWELVVAGGVCMIPLTMISFAAVASIIYHFRTVTVEKLTPQDFIENLLTLLERGETEKARSLCKQQTNLISGVALQGLNKLNKGLTVVQEAIQAEGKSRLERLWRNLGYLGDMAVIAPMLGLLGTVFGMIQAFNYQAFKAGMINPLVLAQGLAQAMITTAYGLIIAIPILAFYAYFRGRISVIMTTSERVAGEMIQALSHHVEAPETRSYSRK